MFVARHRCVAAAAAALLLATCVLSDDAARRVVRTRHGAVRGVSKESSTGRAFLAFYNLPYAKPPVGPLRFKDPQPPDAWVHIRDATVPGASCTQYKMPLPPSGTEDCLYLNVFTPELKPDKLLPVMFWIHGGAWRMGGATWTEPDFLLDHDVVLVSINYRLGPLGFLSTEDEAAPGNFGLKDQVAALKWTRENIEAFGGDPGRVTIFGESAGGGSVHYLMLSPLAKGLFQRAISQSGVAEAPWALPLPGAAEKARKLATLLGCPAEPSAVLVDCLRGVDEYKITTAQGHFMEWMSHPAIPFRPVVEDEGGNSFLPKHPSKLQPHTATPWLIGVTKDEGCLQTVAFLSNYTLLQELEQNSERLLPMTVQYQTSPKPKLITKKIYDFYFPSGVLYLDALTKLYSDAWFNWNTDDAIRRFKDTAPVYYYLLSYDGKYGLSKPSGRKEKNLGVCHGDDLLYLFSNNTFHPVTGERPEKDMEVVRAMTKLWTNFAATGNPTPYNEPFHWPRVTSENELEYLDIGEKLEVKKGLFQERVDFWRSLPLRETDHGSTFKEEL